MSGQLHDMTIPIKPQDTKRVVPVLKGAAEILVTHRDMRNKYQTNRSIKTWATYFLLKSLTTSGIIINWTGQKQLLLPFCKMTENCFRARIAELQKEQLITITAGRCIKLCSYEKAAEILGIEYEGTIKITYDESLPGQQIFQYFLRAEEIRGNQHRQLKALGYYASKNPLLKEQLLLLMIEQGADAKKLQENVTYFASELLHLQQQAFKDGSPLLSIIHTLRADTNRSVRCIRDQHGYKSAQSVSYMKQVMKKMEIITVTHVVVESDARARLYLSLNIPGEKHRGKELYKYIPSKKITAWALTDQVNFRYTSEQPAEKLPKHNDKNSKAA